MDYSLPAENPVETLTKKVCQRRVCAGKRKLIDNGGHLKLLPTYFCRIAAMLPQIHVLPFLYQLINFNYLYIGGINFWTPHTKFAQNHTKSAIIGKRKKEYCKMM